MGHNIRNMECSGTESNEDHDSPAQDVSEKKRIRKFPRDCSCDILVKNVTTFCSCLKNLPEAKLKTFGLIALAEEISRQPNIDCATY